MRYTIILVLGLLISAFTINNEKSLIDFKINNEAGLYHVLEEIQFSVTTKFLDGEKNNKLLKLVLEDSTGDVVISKLLLVKKGVKLNSYFVIPDGIPSGAYVLSCNDLTNSIVDQGHLSTIHVLNPKTFDKAHVASNTSTVRAESKNRTYSVNPIQIKGVLTLNNEGVNNEPVILQSRGQTNRITYSVTDSLGEFNFYDSLFGENEIMIGTANYLVDFDIKLSNLNYIKNTEKVDFKPYKLPKSFLDDTDILKDVILKMNYSNYVLKELSVDRININFDKTVILDEYMAFSSIYETIKELIPLKKIKKSENELSIFLLNDVNNNYHKKEPLFLIDGFIVYSFNEILDLDVSEVHKIETAYKFHNNFNTLGRIGQHGVLSVTTLKGDYVPKNGGIYLQVSGLESTH